MTEDKLSHDERLRLECLNQATQLFAVDHNVKPAPEHVVKRARVYEQYVSGADEGDR